MDLIDKLNDISKRISKTKEHIETEEATKNAFIMPFIQALGYDIFDPTEVVPEFTADIGIKKSEKVDYVIKINGEPLIVIECKSCNSDLDKEHVSQLFKYFAANTPAKFGILTNGINYRFYTDIENPNIMDDKPFLEINMEDIKESDVKELKMFMRDIIDPIKVSKLASELKYTKEIKKSISNEFKNPSDEFVKFFAKQTYSGVLTKNIREQFVDITKIAFKQFIKEEIDNRLKDALDKAEEKPPKVEESKPKAEEKKIVTTEDEWEGYYTVKSILRETIDPQRVVIHDVVNYCSILLDGHKHKPICRFRFNTKNKKLSLFDGENGEERISIDNINDIYKYTDRLKATVNSYDSK